MREEVREVVPVAEPGDEALQEEEEGSQPADEVVRVVSRGAVDFLLEVAVVVSLHEDEVVVVVVAEDTRSSRCVVLTYE